jgi:hypothetical protein
MIQLDLVWEMLNHGARPPALPRLDAAVAWTGSGLATAFRLGATLRLFGMRAVVDTEARGQVEAKAWCRALGAANLIHCRGGATVSWTAGSHRTHRLPPEQVAGRLAGSAVG